MIIGAMLQRGHRSFKLQLGGYRFPWRISRPVAGHLILVYDHHAYSEWCFYISHNAIVPVLSPQCVLCSLHITIAEGFHVLEVYEDYMKGSRSHNALLFSALALAQCSIVLGLQVAFTLSWCSVTKWLYPSVQQWWTPAATIETLVRAGQNQRLDSSKVGL